MNKEELSEIKEKLGINNWLELIKEDKNLNGAYISISQCIWLLEQENKRLKENAENNDKVVDKINWENQLFKKENQELKSQIEDISEELELVRCDLHNRISERDSYERELNECLSQQKEFIEYLDDLIKQNETVVEVSKYGLPKNCSKLLINFYKEIFSKYQEIIGGNKDEK